MERIIKRGTEIVLNIMEQEIVKAVASQRFQNNRNLGVQNLKRGPQSNEYTDINGFGAEMAFCKLFNVFPDFSTNIRSAKEDKGDAELHIDEYDIIDVKATKYINGMLISPIWKINNKVVKAYALMVGEFPSYVFKGFMPTEILIKESRIKDLGGGKLAYVAKQNELYEVPNALFV